MWCTTRQIGSGIDKDEKWDVLQRQEVRKGMRQVGFKMVMRVCVDDWFQKFMSLSHTFTKRANEEMGSDEKGTVIHRP